MENREHALSILQEEAELQEIVKLVGQDSLSAADRLTLESAKMIREDFLQQNAFVDTDNYSEYIRQARLLNIILEYDKVCRAALDAGAKLDELLALPVKERISRAKVVPISEYLHVYDEILEEVDRQAEEAKGRSEADD